MYLAIAAIRPRYASTAMTIDVLLNYAIVASRKGQLVGFPEDDQPMVIQLEGTQDTIEFWCQREAIEELQRQILAAIAEHIPMPTPEKTLPDRPAHASSRPSLFGRKRSRAQEAQPVARSVQTSTSVEVASDEVYFRSESAFGLFETLRERAILVSIVV